MLSGIVLEYPGASNTCLLVRVFGRELIITTYLLFLRFRIQKSNSADKTTEASNSNHLNGLSNGGDADVDDVDDDDEQSDDQSSDEEDGGNNGGLSDDEELVDMEDLGTFVQVVTQAFLFLL